MKTLLSSKHCSIKAKLSIACVSLLFIPASSFKMGVNSVLRKHTQTKMVLNSSNDADVSALSQEKTGGTVMDNSQSSTVDIYPYSYSVSDSDGQYSCVKKIHMIRHAQGYHNVNKAYRDIKNLDARLTDLGKQQCADLSQQILESPEGSTFHQLLKNTELVVTSPMTRCIQTASLCLPSLIQTSSTMASNSIPFVAHESVRETVNYACDIRRPISEISNEFENVNFNYIEHDHDDIWKQYEDRVGSMNEFTSHRESAELHVVAGRARLFFDWLRQRPEKEIVVCSHSAFLRCVLNWGQPGGVPQKPPQDLDNRDSNANDIPVFRYCSGTGTNDDDDDVGSWEQHMRGDYENCELRSFQVAL